MDSLCVLDEGSSHQRETFATETESVFKVREFSVAAHQAIEWLADMLSRDEVEGVRLQRPVDLMARARSLMTKADSGASTRAASPTSSNFTWKQESR